MNYPTKVIDEITRLSFLGRGVMMWSSLLFAVLFLAYLLYVRKFPPPSRLTSQSLAPD